MRLDDILPEWHYRERHVIEIDAPADVVFRAVADVTWHEVPVFRTLMGLRRGRTPQAQARILASMADGGFAVLDRLGNELVLGTLSRTRFRGAAPLPAGEPADGFRGFADPGHWKIAVNFHRRGSTVSTETRVWATDERARRAFRPYWLAVRGPSGMIRRVWLRAVRERAHNEPVFL